MADSIQCVCHCNIQRHCIAALQPRTLRVIKGGFKLNTSVILVTMTLFVALIFTAGWSLAVSHPSHYLRVDLFGDYDKLTRPNHQVKVKLRHSLTRLAVDPIKEESL